MGIKRDTIVKHARRDPAATDSQIAARASASVSYVAKIRSSEPGLRRRGAADGPAAASCATLRPESEASPAAEQDPTREAIRYLASVCDGAVALDEVGFSSSTVSLGHQLAALDDWTDDERNAAVGVVWAHRKQLEGVGFATAQLAAPAPFSGRVRDVAVLRFEKGSLLLTGIQRETLHQALDDESDAVTYSQTHKAWVVPAEAAKGAAGEKLADWCLRRDVPVHITDSVPADIAAPISQRVAECRSDTGEWLHQLEVTDNLPGSEQARQRPKASDVHYHVDDDGTVWLWGNETASTFDPLSHTDTLRSGVVVVGRTVRAQRPVAAFRIEGDHSPTAVAAALVRNRQARARAAEEAPHSRFGRREPLATISGGGAEPTTAEVDAAYQHLVQAAEEDSRIHSERIEAAARARAEAEAETAAKAAKTREAAERRRDEQRRQRRADAWAQVKSAPVCAHARTRDGRILVEVPSDSDGKGVYCVEHNGERQPVQSSGRPFVARYGKLAGKRTVWAVTVPKPVEPAADGG